MEANNAMKNSVNAPWAFRRTLGSGINTIIVESWHFLTALQGLPDVVELDWAMKCTWARDIQIVHGAEICATEPSG